MGNTVTINPPETIERIRQACQLAARMRQYAGSLVKPGITTDEIDRAVHEKIIQAGAYPSPLGYYGFPKSICTSVNEVVVHGIPDSRKLQEGDIVKIDVSVFYNGVHGDCCGSFIVGRVDEQIKRLIRATHEAVHRAIRVCRPGARLSIIGNEISDHAEANGFSVVRTFFGHGLGTDLHMYPFVMHHRNRSPVIMQPGMIFTIEPMLVTGSPDLELWDDGWTAVTKDGGRAAQYEESILITEDGAEILTQPVCPIPPGC